MPPLTDVISSDDSSVTTSRRGAFRPSAPRMGLLLAVDECTGSGNASFMPARRTADAAEDGFEYRPQVVTTARTNGAMVGQIVASGRSTRRSIRLARFAWDLGDARPNS